MLSGTLNLIFLPFSSPLSFLPLLPLFFLSLFLLFFFPSLHLLIQLGEARPLTLRFGVLSSLKWPITCWVTRLNVTPKWGRLWAHFDVNVCMYTVGGVIVGHMICSWWFCVLPLMAWSHITGSLLSSTIMYVMIGASAIYICFICCMICTVCLAVVCWTVDN